jgi:hypothetical protein
MAPSDPVKSGPTPLPLAHLRGGPERPRTRPRGDNAGDIWPGADSQIVANAAEHRHGAEALPAEVRLLNRARAASYLGIGLDTLQGRLPRLVLPGTRCVRFDPRALDRFGDGCCEIPNTAPAPPPLVVCAQRRVLFSTRNRG